MRVYQHFQRTTCGAALVVVYTVFVSAPQYRLDYICMGLADLADYSPGAPWRRNVSR